jgi:UDP-2,4-diacetamido-2,4,6-trideoxy-beta-L-altropyranose hydrolase
MKTVIIRTNISHKVGLGHLFRMKNLAKELSKENRVIFLLDKDEKNIGKIINFKCIFLYKKDEKFISQIDDAVRSKKIINNVKADLLIIDDYRLNNIWENFFYKKIKTVVFDDTNNKRHKCDILIDSKWEGKLTVNRYKKLLPKDTIKLLGPKFSIINLVYKKNKKKNKFYNLLFYLGGAGNFDYYKELIENLCKVSEADNFFRINIVVGPLSKGKDKLVTLLKKYSNIKIIENNFNITKILPEIDLYLGVASSIIYELNYYKIPSVLFSVSNNQKNNTNFFSDLGFYFYVRKNDLINNCHKIAKLILILFKNLKRLESMNQNIIKIDKFGCKRIVACINRIENPKNFVRNDLNLLYEEEFKKKREDDGVYKVNDSQINQYLNCRNIKSNRKNSINSNKISNLDHYLWWFGQGAKLYYYVRKKRIRLYFFHKKEKIKNIFYYYGGWFKTYSKVSIGDLMLVINWQIKIYNKYSWLAIIKKSNRFVYNLNLYLGFKKVLFNKHHLNFFRNININNYYLLKK